MDKKVASLSYFYLVIGSIGMLLVFIGMMTYISVAESMQGFS